MLLDDEGRRRLANAVRTRRAELGLAQDSLTQHGGPGELTVRKIEHAEPVQYRERTMAQLETALQWKPGTVRGILSGTASDDPGDWNDPTSQGFVTSGFGMPRTLWARDAAIRALLGYAEELAASYGARVAATRSAVMAMAQELLTMPHQPPTGETSDDEGGE
jgi:hypothetical protein